MKKTSILIILTGLLIGCLSFAVMNSTSIVTTLNEEGFAIGADSQIAASLSKESNYSKQLIELTYDDTIYSGISGYYAKEKNTKIDSNYPIFTHNGTSLRFLNDENWLITNELVILQSFEGLYLTNGRTYDAELDLVDLEEFILLSINNGTYMVAQDSFIENELGSFEVPINSILKLNETKVSLFEYKNGYLNYKEIKILPGSIFKIGENIYDYDSLLEGLGYTNEAIINNEKGKESGTLIDNAFNVINNNQKNKIHNGSSSDMQGNYSEIDNNDTNENAKDGNNKIDEQKNNDSDGNYSSESDKISEIENILEKELENGEEDIQGEGEGSLSAETLTKKDDKDSKKSEQSESEESENDKEEKKESDENLTPEYKKPRVNIDKSSIKSWVYAIEGKLDIEDKSGALYKGVTVTIYKSKRISNGVEKGKSVIARKAYYQDSEFRLSILPPDSTLYLQYTYKYDEPIYETKDGIKVITGYIRHSESSDLIEVKTLPIENNVKTINLSLNNVFAYSNNGFKFTDISIENSSAYDQTDETFANFIKNSIPYVNKIEFILEPVNGGESITISAGSKVVKNASSDEKSTFIASSSKIKSNTKYKCEIKIRDKYRNEMPVNVVGLSDYLYTQKNPATFTYEEIENNNKYYKFSITVNDEDSSLLKDADGKIEPIKLRIIDNQNENNTVILSGTVVDDDNPNGVAITSDDGYITIENPKSGNKYIFTIDSLQYEHTYLAYLYSKCDLNPDGFKEARLIDDEYVQGSKYKIFTSSLMKGKIYYDAVINNGAVTDSSIQTQFIMTSESYYEVLDLIDYYEIELIPNDSKAIVPQKVRLEKESLQNIVITADAYNESTGTFEIQSAVAAGYDDDGNLISKAKPHIYLYGDNSMIGKTVWDAIQMSKTVDQETEEETLNDSYYICYDLLDKSLSTKTEYSFGINAVVVKGTTEYYLSTKINPSKFKTLKIEPEISDYTFFVAADIAELQNFYVYDPDSTIYESTSGTNGYVNIKLYYNGNLVDSATVDPLNHLSEDEQGETITFDGLMMNANYTIVISPSVYNDTDYLSGETRDKIFETINFKSGSSLYTNIELDGSSSFISDDVFKAILNVEGFDKDGVLTNDENIYLSLYRSDTIKYPVYDENNDLLEDNADYKCIPLSLNKDKEYTVTKQLILELDKGYSYKIIAKVNHKGKTFTLKEYEFNTMRGSTDNGYVVVTNNKEMVDAINKDPYCNIVVANNFEHYIDCQYKFYGTLDFNGYTITKKQGFGGYLLRYLMSGAVIKNLNYAYPDGYTKTGNVEPIVESNYGTIEDIVVTFEGVTNVYSAASGTGRWYVINTNNYGTIQRFAVIIKDDLTYTRQANAGECRTSIVTNANSGIVQDGYIYCYDDAGVAFRNMSNTAALTSFFVSNYWNTSQNQLNNIYVKADVWFTQQAAGVSNDYCGIIGETAGNIEGIYYVGDYYQLTSSTELLPSLPIYSERFITKNVYPTSEHGELYHITEATSSYTNPITKIELNYANPMILNDVDWQKEMLGDAFEIDDVVANGYYPRVIMSDCMMKHQDYYSLPILPTKSIPILVSDGYPTGSDYTKESDHAHILLRFKNDRQISIKSLSIKGLDVTEIINVGTQEDGLYDVIAVVNVANDSTAEYLSQYTVENFGYANGSRQLISSCNYVTKNISFYKEISTVQDWININGYTVADTVDKNGTKIKGYTMSYNKTKYWNYRIVKDIDFASSKIDNVKNVPIDGYISNTASAAWFLGVIDGAIYDEEGNITGLHKLSNIDLDFSSAGTSVPASVGLIPSNGGILKNLVIDNIVVKIPESSSASNVGGAVGSMIPQKNTIASVQNVHVVNSSITGQGNFGGLIGYTYAIVENCSVQDTKITDVSNTKTTNAGGLVGSFTRSNLLFGYVGNCFVSNIEMDINKCKNVNGVGGIFGQFDSVYAYNFYATGSISVTGDSVGGIVGLSYGTLIQNVYSYVNIEANGSSINGLGRTNGNGNAVTSAVAIGDIVSSGVAYRTAPASLSLGSYIPPYAYSGQTVNAIKGKDTAYDLLSGEDLQKRQTWVDKIQTGDSFDYSFLAYGKLPALYKSGTTELLYGQSTDTLKTIPGLGGEHLVEVTSAKFDNSTDRYNVFATLKHPGITTKQLLSTFESCGNKKPTNSDDYISINIDGMEDVTIELSAVGSTETGQETRISVSCAESSLVKRMNNYTISIDYKITTSSLTYDNKLKTIFEFETIPVWEISNLEEWNAFARDHGKSNENAYITGVIDFKGCDTEYDELLIANLYGSKAYDKTADDINRSQTGPDYYLNLPEDQTNIDMSDYGPYTPYESGEPDEYKLPGFYNLNYSNHDGRAWIQTVSGSVDNLVFKDITADYSDSSIVRTTNGLIGTAYGSNNCVYQNIDLKFGANTGSYCGIYSQSKFSPIDNCILYNVNISVSSKSATNYVGALAYSYYQITNC